MDLKAIKLRGYDNFRLCDRVKNKPKTNPNKANLKNDQNECKCINNNGLRQKSCFSPKIKTNPIQSQNKANLPPAQGWGLNGDGG